MKCSNVTTDKQCIFSMNMFPMDSNCVMETICYVGSNIQAPKDCVCVGGGVDHNRPYYV